MLFSLSLQPGALISGRPDVEQRQLLNQVFLEADAEISTDEGCTATVVLVQQSQENDLLVQVGYMMLLLLSFNTLSLLSKESLPISSSIA